MAAVGWGLAHLVRAETWAAEVLVLSGAEPGTVPGLGVSAGDGALSPEVTCGALTAHAVSKLHLSPTHLASQMTSGCFL